MRVVEIRDLDGPNVFLLQPAIKLEIEATEADLTPAAIAGLEARLESLGLSDEGESGGLARLGELLTDMVSAMHRRIGVPVPETIWKELESPGHLAVAFGWTRRRFAVETARLLGTMVTEESSIPFEALDPLRALAEGLMAPGDAPQVVADDERSIPIIGITGTNGKTTTTRLTAHVLQRSGRKVGWSSSTGVYIEGEQVLSGDYTGPAGARRVLSEPEVEVAVLETARGGILLRGLAYESNDVSIFINVSGDHLDLHGVRTVEGLAEVKATVVRVTRPEGYAVLNADDPLVRGVAGSIRASPFWVAKDLHNPTIVGHVAAGGRALFVRDGVMMHVERGEESPVVAVADVPMTFGGRAPHMIENALSGAAACLALGLTVEEVREGLTSFRNSPEQNTGRLNVFDIDGVTVIIDYAHNEAGLGNLLAFGRAYLGEGARLTSIIGTAGDRTDNALRAIGRIAAAGSDRVIVKETTKYQRGRDVADMNQLFLAGIREGKDVPHQVEPDELHAIDAALADAKAGDVVAMMCIEQVPDVQAKLADLGRSIS